MALGSRPVLRPHSEIVNKVQRNRLRRERTKEGECRVAGSGVSGSPPAFLSSFFANLNQSRGRASIDMKHVRHSDRPFPR